MTVRVCQSNICERRDTCYLQRGPGPSDLHVIYFTPPEERNAICPHYFNLPTTQHIDRNSNE